MVPSRQVNALAARGIAREPCTHGQRVLDGDGVAARVRVADDGELVDEPGEGRAHPGQVTPVDGQTHREAGQGLGDRGHVLGTGPIVGEEARVEDDGPVADDGQRMEPEDRCPDLVDDLREPRRAHALRLGRRDRPPRGRPRVRLLRFDPRRTRGTGSRARPPWPPKASAGARGSRHERRSGLGPQASSGAPARSPRSCWFERQDPCRGIGAGGPSDGRWTSGIRDPRMGR